MNKIKPVHPGEILLREFIKPMGLPQAEIARNMSVSGAVVNRLTRGESSITDFMARKLSVRFGTTTEFWMNLQSHYDSSELT